MGLLKALWNWLRGKVDKEQQARRLEKLKEVLPEKLVLKYRKALVLDKQKADDISLVLCEVFHEKNIDIGWAFKGEPPRFCGLIPEVLDYQESDEEIILKLRLPSMKAKPTDPSKLLGYSVIIGKILKDHK